MQFSIQVLDEDGDAVVGKRVGVMFTSIFRGGLEAFTDDDGLAVFDYDVDPGEIDIYVNGEKQATHYVEDGDGFTVNI